MHMYMPRAAFVALLSFALAMTMGLSTAAANGSAQITGTVGEIVDSDAGTGFEGQEGFFLRYVGDPAPAAYSHTYQWGVPYIETLSPEAGPVTLEGTLDLTTRQLETTAFIGLNDKTSLAVGTGGTPAWTSGANIYIDNQANGDVEIGVTDGNAGGGEYVQVSHTIPAATANAANALGVTFVVDGTVDPSTCGGAGAGGCMTLTVDGFAPLTDSYGEITPTASAVPEFGDGAHPGWDASHSEGGDVGYDLTVSPVVVTDPQSKDDCRDGGHEDFGFRNQGQCVRFVETGPGTG